MSFATTPSNPDTTAYTSLHVLTDKPIDLSDVDRKACRWAVRIFFILGSLVALAWYLYEIGSRKANGEEVKSADHWLLVFPAAVGIGLCVERRCCSTPPRL